jgi:branched-chain amino acid transport system substrate-binding protein
MHRLLIVTLGCTALVITACSSSSNKTTAGQSSASTQPAGAAATTQPAGAAATSAANGTPLKFGYVNVDEGSISLPGYDHGVEAAVKYVNSALGGVNGRPIKIVPCQVDSTAETNQACGQQFANDGSLTGVLTGIFTNGAPFYSALQSSGLPIYGGVPISTPDYTSPDTHFYLGGSLTAEEGAGVLLKQVKPNAKKVNLLCDDNAPGAQGCALFKTALGPGVTVNEIRVNPGATNVLPQAEAAVSGNPDAIGSLLTIEVCQLMVKAFSQVKPTAPVFTTTQCVNPLTAAAGDIEGWYYASFDEPATLAAGVDPALDSFKTVYAKYASTPYSENFALEGWGEVLTLRNVLASISGPVTRQSVGAALKDFKGPVVLGPKTVSCPGPTSYTAICSLDSPIFAGVWKAGVTELAVPDGPPVTLPPS